MSMTYDSATVNESQTQEYQKRFICQADLEKFSVELVVQCTEDEENGVLTVWNDKEVITNNREVDVDLEGRSQNEVRLFFENFLIGDVKKYLRR